MVNKILLLRRVLSCIVFGLPRSEGWSHYGMSFSTWCYPHLVMWCYLPIWRCPGKVPNRISFSRLPHFLIVCPKYDSCFLFVTLSNRLLFCSINHRRQGGYIFALSCSFACLSAGLRNIYVCQSVYLSVCLINFIHQAVDKYNETNTGK